MIRFSEKGGKETEIPVHHKLEELLDQYLETSGLKNRPTAPLFPIAAAKTRKLGNRAATRIDAARMLKRRLKDAGLSDAFPILLGLPESRISWRMEERWRWPNG
jgi:integrase/recombinase XerD